MAMDRTIRANSIRMLSADAVEKAQSGHPGMPLGMANIAEVLWSDFLKHNPKNPTWLNRDRFVLSNGHGSMLLYALLHLTGYDLSIDDLKAFRQLHSKTPGHPEWGETPGVESTSGPLGQGLAHGVGMAMSEAMLAHTFNKPNFPIIDHFTYVFAGDGCLMEGISHEVCSLAGTWGLGKLVVFWDDNQISIDGSTDAWFKDNTKMRFESYGWQVLQVDGHDPDAIAKAIEMAKEQADQPTLIACKTTIGFGAQGAGSASLHGAPLGSDGIAALRENLKWQHPPFEVPDAVYQSWQASVAKNDAANWDGLFEAYQTHFPKEAQEIKRRLNGDLPEQFNTVWETIFAEIESEKDKIATRKASLWCLNRFAQKLPELVGGSADLTSSNLTKWDGAETWPEKSNGRYVYFGVREFGMMAIQNGMALHGGFIPFSGTFLVFADYGKNAIRMSALMQRRVIFVLTHDSIGLGEDGPTHQPIEQLAMLRATPNLHTWRPSSLRETAVAWQQALQYQGPSCLILSRQGIEPFNAPNDRSDVEKGAEIIQDPKDPNALLIASGSEVPLALSAAKLAEQQGIRTRVVSMPCMETFRDQNQADRDRILPPTLRTHTVVIEACHPMAWHEWIDAPSRVLGMRTFGASAPANKLYEHFELTPQSICDALQHVCASKL